MDALNQLNLAAPIAATYNDVEETILCHIAEQLAANPDTLINATSEWRIKMLAQMGKLNKDTAKIIAAKVGKVPEQVEQVVNTAINSVLSDNGLTMTDRLSGNIVGTLENYNRQAVISKYNQVNTVMQYKAKQAFVNGVNGVADRFDRIQQKALANAQEYLDKLNDNAMAVVLGEKSRTEAVRETISKMCDKGIPAFVDASGKEWSPEAYVNMDIRNTAKNSALAAQWSCMDELGQDVIVVSSHSGARPLCYPYQGKLYSRSNKSGTIKDARGKEYKYEPLSSTSFGKPAGLFGINCGHRMRGISEGMFINREKQYDKTENGEEYEQVCEQRRQERKIRADKTKQDALRAAGDDEGANNLNAKIAAENKQMKAYCEKNGLSYRQDRTQTYGYSDASKKKKPEPLIETVDKSSQSGIMNVGSEKVALEYQRYGRNKDTLVNKTYIDGGEYRKKFDTISDNADVNKAIYSSTKDALKHRSGTEFEDMYWFDSTTGQIIAKEINSTEKRVITYSAATRKAVSENHSLIALHTHPSSMPPSAADFNSCFRNGYKTGIVACHDGKVFAYTSKQEISEQLYTLYIDSFLANGKSEYEAQILALGKLKVNHIIDFWEVG